MYAYGGGYSASTTYDLYVVEDQVWSDGMAIPSRVPGTAATVASDASGGIPVTMIWASAVVGSYDVVVDVNGNGYYDAGVDALDDMDVNDAGYEVIPEFPTAADTWRYAGEGERNSFWFSLSSPAPVFKLTHRKPGSNTCL